MNIKLDSHPEKWDLVVVGAGPVGQALALLVGLRGHKVLVVEKQPSPYPLPRAVHFTPDISRLLDQVGVTDRVATFAHEASVYEWQNAKRETLIAFTDSPKEDQGWPWSTMFNQPGLERELLHRISEVPSITLRWLTELKAIERREQTVLSTLSDEKQQYSVESNFLIGCDGANSTVRGFLNPEIVNLGFFYDWLVVDILEKNPRTWVPENLQVCDPHRPTSAVSGGPGKRRLEFMKMDRDGDDFATVENCWNLLSEWDITPENAELERFAMYRFQSRWAKTWYDRGVGIAGDAAHQVPPFFGVGMVSGQRDSANLAWKISAVLEGWADKSILETYTSERSVEVQNSIGMSVELGKVICELDPEKVAGRDAHFLATGPNPAHALPPVAPDRLGTGILLEDDPLQGAFTGALSANDLVEDASGRQLYLDQLNYGGFTLWGDAQHLSESACESALEGAPAGPRVIAVRVVPRDYSGAISEFDQAGKIFTVKDVRGTLLRRLSMAGECVTLTRPDFITFGGASDPAELMTAFSARVSAHNSH